MMTKRKNSHSDFVRVLPILFLNIFFVCPIIIWLILNYKSISLNNIIKPQFGNQFFYTALISTITTLFGIILSYPIALLWWICKSKTASNIIMLLLFLPTILGLITRNYSWMNILSYTSFEYTLISVILVMVYIFIPFSFFVLIQGFANISDNALESAKIMGANIQETFGKIIIPQTQRHVLIASFFIFTNSLCYYITPYMIGGGKYDMIGNIIWNFVNIGRFSESSSISITLISYMIPILFIAMSLILKRKKYFMQQ